jgi:hypothetical protein
MPRETKHSADFLTAYIDEHGALPSYIAAPLAD